jgi:hypothetical protein
MQMLNYLQEQHPGKRLHQNLYLMFTRHRSWNRKKPQHRLRWLTLLLLLIGVPVGLELLVRWIASFTSIGAQLTADQSAKATLIQTYQLRFLSASGEPYQSLPQQGDLLAVRNPLMGYHLLPDQKSQFWIVNPQGFRDAEPVPLAKPEGEVRIFVLGGSAAFGQLSSSDQTTFAHQLETLLNQRVANQRANPNRFQPAILPYRADQVAQALALPPRIPDRQYRVINAAVPGYASGNELAMLVQRVAAYNPDMLVVINSYADLMLPSTQAGADIPGLDNFLLEGERESWSAQASEAIKQWFNGLYLVRVTQHYVLRSPQSETELAIPLNMTTAAIDQPLGQQLTADAAELDRRVSRYRYHLLQMVRWGVAGQKRVFIGIQPEITSRQSKVVTPQESKILSKLGNTYVERVKTGYGKLTEAAQQMSQSSANVSVLNLYTLYETFDKQAFQNPISLTDEANKILAERFYQAIANTLVIKPQPFGSGY